MGAATIGGMKTLILFLLLSLPAQAGSLGGVTLPDQATVAGQPVVLNGLGLRTKYFLSIYVGALYLPKKTTSAKEAIEIDAPKRIEMAFIYSQVTQQQLIDTWNEGVAKNPDAAALRDRFDQLNGMMETVNSGDHIVLDYAPGKGTTVTVKGKVKGTIPGADFMKALFAIFIGDDPPTTRLKNGMLGQ